MIVVANNVEIGGCGYSQQKKMEKKLIKNMKLLNFCSTDDESILILAVNEIDNIKNAITFD